MLDRLHSSIYRLNVIVNVIRNLGHKVNDEDFSH
jgi:hypothetical protein